MIQPPYYAFPLNTTCLPKGPAFWNKLVLNDEEVQRVVALADAGELRAWPIGSVESNIHTGKILLTADTAWLYNRLTEIVRVVNRDQFGFDLYGLEAFGYMRYDATRATATNNYWHMDIDIRASLEPQRKLSCVLQLSDPSEYDGGDLVFQRGNEPELLVKKARGMMYCFPAYMLHRVTPVTRGVRRTIPFWAIGPDFR